MGLNMAKHPDFPPDTKKSETPLDAWSFFNKKILIIHPISQVIFIIRIKMPTSAWFHALGGIPEAPGAVVVPLELGLELTHLRLVLDEEEGADLLSEHLHTGPPDPDFFRRFLKMKFWSIFLYQPT